MSLGKERYEEIKNSKVEFFVENLKGYFGNINDYVVVIWADDGTILEFKENGDKLLGYSPEQIEGKKWLDVLIDEKEKEEMEWVYKKLVNDEILRYYVNPVRDINGVKKTFLWYNSKIESVQDNKKIFLSIGFSLDAVERLNRKIQRYERDLNKMSAESENLKFKISKQDFILKQKDEMIKDYKTRVEFLAFYDELTKLPNKNSLMRWLNLRISQADNMSTYLIFLEVRNLEKLNVMYGYDLVDELIIHISKRIEEILGKETKIFKIGFDRFAIICNTDNISEFIENLLQKLLVTYNINGNLMKVSYNIGATAMENINDSTANVIRKCDLALIRAKEKGLNEYEIFKPSLEVQTLKEGIIERELRHGLDLNEFVVFYQPIINLKNNQICGFEALLRWHYLKSVFVSPLEFIPVAEKCGLIVELGNIVLEQSLKVAKLLSRYINDEFIISINISPRQFSDREFIRSTIQILENEELENVKLQFEITEKLAVENIDYTIEVINQLRKYNIIFALDDFGVDYSSLNYLRRLPIQAVKIDKSFIQDIEKDETYFIVETIIKLCKKLGLNVVAEGVETEEHYRAVKELGCDYVQGYFISKPLAVEEMIKFIEKYKSQN
ncbi:EAL domain-containing protein [Caldicellulosiruptor acetigenus]|uniref:sensor domain-containing protein n=1 Tax=Caldicellulosiruptor acetigenus TaxID=301953 RepID=UPI0003F4EDCB|nr:EAL domain-containing protein [Caldicellulosiruptor acetigenus]WAM35735.1 EAL domain-containing protein [Caldicellulosiruptor acetigenus]